jgi:TRAP-type C4-dicarboxylate transport system permease small subunit
MEALTRTDAARDAAQAPPLRGGTGTKRLCARIEAVFDRIENAVLIVTMTVMALLTFANVVTRYLSDVSFAFTEEYTISLLTITCLLGMATAIGRSKHIRMPFFFDLLPKTAQRWLETVFMLGVVFVFAIVALYGYRSSVEEFLLDERTPGLGNPAWIYSMWVPIISVAVAVRALLKVDRIWTADVEVEE